MILKRAFDVCIAALGLAVLLPLMVVIAVAIKLDSSGPVLFRQERIGRNGRHFRIHKFRSMYVSRAGADTGLTVGRDARVTSVGSFLRRHKLDELPQLIDVFIGEMSLVGPRPEVPKFVEMYPPDIRDIVLSVRPGMTDRASIAFRQENAILGSAVDPTATYIRDVMPVKLKYCLDYVQTRSFVGDLRIIHDTISILLRSASLPLP